MTPEADISPVFSLQLRGSYIRGEGEIGTPIFHRSKTGELVLLWYRDPAVHGLVSRDEGRTWLDWPEAGSWPAAGIGSVVRHGGELILLGNDKSHPWYEGTPQLWRSSDEGLTWTGGERITNDSGPWACMNDRVLVTSAGRLIAPVDHLLGREGPDPDRIGTIVSDDGGRTWRRKDVFGPPPPLPDQPEGFGEPAVVELPDGKCWMVFRTIFGQLWQALSEDGGLTWGPATPTGLASPLSAVNAERIPGTGAVLLVWNLARPGPSRDFGHCPGIYRPRSPLVFAVSHDQCRTWTCPVVVDTGTGVYPSIHVSDTHVFLVFLSNPDPAVTSGVSYGVTLNIYDKRQVLDLPPWNAGTIQPWIADGRVAHWLALNTGPGPQSITNSL